MQEFFHPSIGFELESLASAGIALLKADRELLWGQNGALNNVAFLKAVRDTGLKTLVNQNGHRSIQFFIAWRRGVRRIKDLRGTELMGLKNFIDPKKFNTIVRANQIRLGDPDDSTNNMYWLNNTFKPLVKCTSKEIRLNRMDGGPIRQFKIGLDLSEGEALSWGLKLAKNK